MRLKLSGPDYKDKDPLKSLEDFKKRVKAYESAYVPLGKYEEEHDLQYIQVCVLRCQLPTAFRVF
jgi:6-phosphofructo-2-kinase